MSDSIHTLVTGIILITHGSSGLQMVNSIKKFFNFSLIGTCALSIKPTDNLNDIEAKISKAVEKLTQQNYGEIIFLVDLVGSTPARLCERKYPKHSSLVSGVNLPMLLKLITLDRSLPAVKLAHELVQTGIKSISQIQP